MRTEREQELLSGSWSIYQEALEMRPNAFVILMLSGGDDSITAYAVAKELGISIDAVMHGRTGTGIRQTREFVEETVDQVGDDLKIADAGTAYEDYVMRKGFFGNGPQAHSFSYHILKANPFRSTISKHFRKGKSGVNILLLNGARRMESERRKETMKDPLRADPSSPGNLWVNLINDWQKHECYSFMESKGWSRNPVSKTLCKSGECMCGTMQSWAERKEASYLYPEWGGWIDDLEAEVMKRFPWRWGEPIKNSHLLEMNGQINMFQPMCVDCKSNNDGP